MDQNTIFQRLIDIKIRLEFKAIPSPMYINERIGECHVYIEEMERYSIETSKEISVIQQALNNSVSEYEMKKEAYLMTEDIKTLPSIKDREAKCNSLLKTETDKIKKYQNELISLNNLLRAVNLKTKNLNRVNADIKMQIRLLEAQLKLSPNSSQDSVTKSLVDELKKGISEDDVFGKAEIEVLTENKIDPTVPLNIEELFNSKEDKKNEKDSIFVEEDLPDIRISEEDLIVDLDNEILSDVPITENVNLNIDFNDQKGGTEAKKETIQTEKIEAVKPNQKDNCKEQIGIDIDELLNNFNLK